MHIYVCLVFLGVCAVAAVVVSTKWLLGMAGSSAGSLQPHVSVTTGSSADAPQPQVSVSFFLVYYQTSSSSAAL